MLRVWDSPRELKDFANAREKRIRNGRSKAFEFQTTMSHTTEPILKYIPNNNIPASESKALIYWILFISLGYHYKVILCGLFGKVLGYKFFYVIL